VSRPGALGAWSGGRFMHYGEPLDDERLEALLRPDDAIPTVITADTYGQGAADEVVGRSLAGLDGDAYTLIGAIGHDFYEGEREGAKGFPRFTDPRLRGPDAYADYLRMATERSLERIGVDAFDVLLLHNPDRTGYTSETVWDGMAALRDAGLAKTIGVAPGPANGFTLDVIDCFERFGDRIDWAMVILSPMEPWPGELCLDAAERHGVRVITRVVDYGGVLWDDVRAGHASPSATTASSARRAGSRPREKLERHAGARRPRPHAFSPLAFSLRLNLAHPRSRARATLIQEPGGRHGERKRRISPGAARRTGSPQTEDDVAQLAADRRQHWPRWRSRAPRPSTTAPRWPTAGRSTTMAGLADAAHRQPGLDPRQGASRRPPPE
jgi:aryl-alcohol dehydrogenase-like predicted oxidoreductase